MSYLKGKENDTIRTETLNSLGIGVLRFYSEDVELELDEVLNEMLEKVEKID